LKGVDQYNLPTIFSLNKYQGRKDVGKQDEKGQIVAVGIPFGQLYPSAATIGTGMTGSACVRGCCIN
jgi:hypothetical protein